MVTESQNPPDIQNAVKQRYASAAKLFTAKQQHKEPEPGSPCCNSAPASNAGPDVKEAFGATLYDTQESEATSGPALQASLGCGVPTAVADLHPGEVVLDLGSGAGADVLIAARRVGPSGRVIGLDMTTEMLELAHRNAIEAGVENVEFLEGYIEDIPLADASVDVIISNCVINLSADKHLVLRQAARVLRPGGRLAISDVIADSDMDPLTKADMESWTGCIAGALSETAYRQALEHAGFSGIDIVHTHRVHPNATAAIIRAGIA